jgi:hypothetical protein
MKAFTSHQVLGIFGAITVIAPVIGGSVSAAEKDQTAAVQTATPASSSIASPTPTPEKKASLPGADIKMGDKFKLGDFNYKILKAVSAGGVKRSFGKPLRAAEGATFVIVDYAVRNDGSKSETMWSNGFTILDSKGREFKTSSEVETAIELASSKGRSNLFSVQLEPGIARTLRAGFEIPKDALEEPLALVIPEKKFLGSKTAKVDLVVTKYTPQQGGKGGKKKP